MIDGAFLSGVLKKGTHLNCMCASFFLIKSHPRNLLIPTRCQPSVPSSATTLPTPMTSNYIHRQPRRIRKRTAIASVAEGEELARQFRVAAVVHEEGSAAMLPTVVPRPFRRFLPQHPRRPVHTVFLSFFLSFFLLKVLMLLDRQSNPI